MKQSGILFVIILFTILSLTACGKSSDDPTSGIDGLGQEPQSAQQPGATPTCLLDKPVQFDGTLLDGHQYSNVILDVPVAAEQFESVEKAKIPFKLRLFNIHYDKYKTGYLGWSLSSEIEDAGSIGFSDTYLGSFSMSGSAKKTDSKTTYVTEDKADKTSKTAVTVIVNGNQIISIQLTYPLTERKDGSNFYTGKDQTLCVKSME